jgi:nucleotide-binding universal stress UspA family protein
LAVKTRILGNHLFDAEALMYKHVLMPVDGSDISRNAIKAGIAFARQLGAKVTAYHALDASHANMYGEGTVLDPSLLPTIDQREREVAARYVGEVGDAAKVAGVEFESIVSRPDAHYRGIIEAAGEAKCDVIFMPSHGRGEFAALLLGSTTQKVLAHSKIPVLVHR